MDFGLSDDQKLLEETVRGFLAEQVPITRVRELRDAPCPNDREVWKALGELGITGILVPEAQGGSGLSLLDAALVSQSLGHAATPTPFPWATTTSRTRLPGTLQVRNVAPTSACSSCSSRGPGIGGACSGWPRAPVLPPSEARSCPSPATRSGV